MNRTLISIIFLIGTAINAEPLVINKVNYPQNTIVVDILKLVLSKTNSEMDIKETKIFNSRPRVVQEVKDGNISLMWAGTTELMQEQLLAIKIPVLKGLYGYRILVIREGEQALFDTISNLEQLRQFTAGQGEYWANNAIMEESSMPMITANGQVSLLSMLNQKRFDYLNNAIMEPWSELDTYREYKLVVEKKLLLVYPFAMYFFVSPENKELAETIKFGLETAIEDGSYDDLFYKSDLIINT